MKYKNNHGLLVLNLDGKEIVSIKDEIIELPESHSHIKALEYKGHIIKQFKNKK